MSACWVFYPWSGQLVRTLADPYWTELRSDRNRYKLTTAEQQRLAAAHRRRGRAVGRVLRGAGDGARGNRRPAQGRRPGHARRLELQSPARSRCGISVNPRRVLAARDGVGDRSLPSRRGDSRRRRLGQRRSVPRWSGRRRRGVRLVRDEGAHPAGGPPTTTPGGDGDRREAGCSTWSASTSSRTGPSSTDWLRRSSRRTWRPSARRRSRPPRPPDHRASMNISDRSAASMIEIDRPCRPGRSSPARSSPGGAHAAVAVRRILLGSAVSVRPLPPRRRPGAGIWGRSGNHRRASGCGRVRAGRRHCGGRVQAARRTSFIEEVVAAATSAPSAGNSQPWRFAWDGRQLRVWLDRERPRSAIDPRCAAGWIAVWGGLREHRHRRRPSRTPGAVHLVPGPRRSRPCRHGDLPACTGASPSQTAPGCSR